MAINDKCAKEQLGGETPRRRRKPAGSAPAAFMRAERDAARARAARDLLNGCHLHS